MHTRAVVMLILLLALLGLGAFLMQRAATPAAKSAPQPVTVFRWKDADGALHLSSERPRAGVAYETVQVDGVLTNLDAPTAPAAATPAPDSAANPNPLKVYTPSGLKQLVDDTHGAARAMQEHAAQTERLVQRQ